MNIDDKYRKYKDIYLKYFTCEREGTSWCMNNPPLSFVRLGNIRKGYAGDGTINLAHYMTWAWLNDDKDRISLAEDIMNILSLDAKVIYDKAIPKWEYKYEPGFFLRDNIKPEDAKKFCLDEIASSYSGNILGIKEDVCHSPFISQDQCWNLLPALKDCNLDGIGYNIFEYIVRNHHVIYNPYLSRYLYNHTYKNLKKPYPERIEDRDKNFRYRVKVKRGAHNWYFAYGFKKAFELFGGHVSKWDKFVSALWYKPFIFLADRFWHPYVCKWFGWPVKNTSYYSLAISTGAWYFGDPHKRILDKMNKALEKGEVFLPEIFVHSKYADKVDKVLLKKWLDNYPEPRESGTIESPIIFMIMYSFYKRI